MKSSNRLLIIFGITTFVVIVVIAILASSPAA